MKLFANIDNVCAVTIILLKHLKVNVTNTTIIETIQNHPNYPSLLSISDALKQWKINNAVAQIAPEQLQELPIPFITQIKKDESTFITVVAYNDTHILYKENTERPVSKMQVSDFKKIWTGIVLLAETQASSGEENYNSKKRLDFLRQLKIPAAALLLLIFSSIIIGTNHSLQLNLLISLSSFTILKLAGIIITTLLLVYEIDSNNPTLQKICSIGKRTNCNAILQSKGAKLFNLISWSEIGFFYFIGTFFTLLFSIQNNISSIIQALSLLNIVVLPYILFSVFYQWRIAKQWCILCLGVQFLLLSEGITTFIFNLHPFQNLETIFSVSIITTLFVAFSIPILVWFIMKPFFLKAQQLKHIKSSFLQLKFNSNIFHHLLMKEKIVIPHSDNVGITIGNPDAITTIIVVSNPYCGPCADVHIAMERLLEYYDLKIQIIFKSSIQEKNTFQSPVPHLLAIATKNDETLTRQALHDWYLIGKKDYNAFINQYPLNGELEKQTLKSDAMNQWCTEMDILYTPTIFMNGYQLPAMYKIEDITYFLND